MPQPMNLQQGIHAASEVAKRLRLKDVKPAVLSNSNNISILLTPLPIVARVFSLPREPRPDARFERELAVAQHLAQNDAPIVPPTNELPAGPHFCEAAAVTLWEFVPHRAAREDDGAAAAYALHLVHNALARFPGELPSFKQKIDECRALLEDEPALRALPSADRKFLLGLHQDLDMRLASVPMNPVPIHGDAHLGNVFMTAEGARWTDFESASLGPREWDIGFVPEIAHSVFEPVDPSLQAILNSLRSLCVSVWCWANYDREEKREAADYHLGLLKQRHGT